MRIVVLLLLFSVCNLLAAEQSQFSGTEFMAAQVAVQDFAQKGYSATGDLRHFTIYLIRHSPDLEIIFVPDQVPGKSIRGGRTEYGLEVHYFVSLKTLKILKSHFVR